MESLEKSRDFFVARKQNQATAEPAFGFERAYTKQKQKSRSDEPAKQEVFVSEKETLFPIQLNAPSGCAPAGVEICCMY